MKGREIIWRAIRFKSPPRIGLSFDRGRLNDFVSASPAPVATEASRPRRTDDGAEEWTDEWGCLRRRLDPHSLGEVVEGPLRTWTDLDTYTPPALDDPALYAGVRARFAAEPDKYRLGWLPGMPFSIGRNLRTMQAYLADVAAEPDQIRRLNRLLRRVVIRVVDAYAALGADAVAFCEDWGTQEGLLVSPEQWRRLYRPEFEAIVYHAESKGMAVFMHSCGAIGPIIEDLIDVGIAVLQFDQPALHGIDHLGERYGGRIAFWCPVDIQQTLPTGNRALIEDEARRLVRCLGSKSGGFIAKNYPAPEPVGIRPEWDDWAYEAFLSAGGAGRTC